MRLARFVFAAALPLAADSGGTKSLALRRRARPEPARHGTAVDGGRGRALQDQLPAIPSRASYAYGYSYQVTMLIGSPPVSIGVDIDTGSSSLAVPSSSCANCAVDIATYNPETSSLSSKMPCDDHRCDSSALLWTPECVSDPSAEKASTAGMDSAQLRAWKLRNPRWSSAAFRRVRLLFDSSSCAGAAAISGVYTLDASQPTVAGEPHWTQTVCSKRSHPTLYSARVEGNCTTYHLQYSEELAESNWPWIIAYEAGRGADGYPSDDGNWEASDGRGDMIALARFAADTSQGSVELALGERVPAKCMVMGEDQDSALAVRAYAPEGPAACCAQENACLHSDSYVDGSGTTGPVYHDRIAVGDVDAMATQWYFKAFDNDGGGVAAGEHFVSSHSGAGIWGLAPSEFGVAERSGVKTMRTVLKRLLEDNGLHNAFALCFDDSPAAFSDGDGGAASSLDLGGADARKYRGEMQHLPMLAGRSYRIAPPLQFNVGAAEGEQMPVPMSEETSQAMEYISIDSGASFTIKLPRATHRAIGSAMVDWFRSQYDTSSGAGATALDVISDLFLPENHGCVQLGEHHLSVTSSMFPTLTLSFANRAHPHRAAADLRFPPESYLEIWPAWSALCLRIEADDDGAKSGSLGAGFIRHYYTLFDRVHWRIGVAVRGDCTPDDEDEGAGDRKSGADAHCASRAQSGCASCVGPIDDLELDSGYCVWCPDTASCHAYDPRSTLSPCANAQGWSQPGLDAAPGGHCSEFSQLDRVCQAAYGRVTDLALRGNRRDGTCTRDAQQAIDSYAAACEANPVWLHQRGKTVRLPGAACMLSVLAGSASVHGMDQCLVPDPAGPQGASCRDGDEQQESCEFALDGECDSGGVCADGTDLVDCYGSKPARRTTCPPHSYHTENGCRCDAGFTADDGLQSCVPRQAGDHTTAAYCDGNNQVDCGHLGTTQDSCEEMGCCWQPVSPNPHNEPWCYRPQVGSAAGANSCRWANDGSCDPADICPAGTDRDDCEGASQPVDCRDGVDEINTACPNPEPGQPAPASCPPECEMVFAPYWRRCREDETLTASLGTDVMDALERFNERCSKSSCSDLDVQDECAASIDWVFSTGLSQHPDWYSGSGLSPTSDRRAVQAWLYHLGNGPAAGGCLRPCGDLAPLQLPFEVWPADACSTSWQITMDAADTHCSETIQWVLSTDLALRPARYALSGLTPSSDRRAVQAWLHHLGGEPSGDCKLPCGLAELDLPFDPTVPRDEQRPRPGGGGH